ncbi:DJ-1/PfpI family protein [Candidatus Lokiarchaeum ossiferum]|uniref:DJ-1/PfpI family protein n=1 Tax=Candidatus Lokiarchaeum ossiferum TaxID=2951803 RepID=UPI00352C3D8D
MSAKFQKKIILMLIFFSIIPHPIFAYQPNSSEIAESNHAITQDLESINVLMLVHNGVGKNGLDVKNLLEAWNCSVETVGITSSAKVICTNKGPAGTISTDLIISDLDNSKLKQYDCLFVPSGGYWDAVSKESEITNFIKKAYKQGLIISSMCVGTGILGNAGKIVEGSKFACHPNSAALITEAGGYIEKANVVIDGQFVTGGTGGGWVGGGHTKAPFHLFSAALVQQILKHKYYSNINLESANNSVNPMEYILSVSINNLSSQIHQLPDVKNHSIEEINLICSQPGNISSEIKLPLESQSDGTYRLILDMEAYRKDQLVVEIKTNNSEIELYRDLKNPLKSAVFGYSIVYLVCVSTPIIILIIRKTRKDVIP